MNLPRAMVVLFGFGLAMSARPSSAAGGDDARRPATPAPADLNEPAPTTPSLYDHPWVWRDDDGAALSLARFRGSTVVITMGYASCQVRCPPTITKLQHLERAFAKQGRPVSFILVTIDPATDTPARLAALRRDRNLTPGVWHLLSGPESQTRELARLLDIAYVDAGGHFEHQVRVIVLDARGRVARRFEGWHFDDASALSP